MLVAQLVDLGLELIRLLLFDHLNVALSDFLYLCEAAVREAIALKANIHQSRILVQGFQHDCFNLFAEEVVRQFDGADLLVSLEGVYQVDEARVVQAARAEVELLELSGASTVPHDHLREEFEDGIAEEVFIAYESL